MSKKDDGGHAFPSAYPMVSIDPQTLEKRRVDDGMSLRDWFAGQAIGNEVTFDQMRPFPTAEILARDAYAIADAMLAVRLEGETK